MVVPCSEDGIYGEACAYAGATGSKGEADRASPNYAHLPHEGCSGDRVAHVDEVSIQAACKGLN